MRETPCKAVNPENKRPCRPVYIDFVKPYLALLALAGVVPAAEPMTEDTIFDLASLTKVVATTTSVMQLVEQGRIRLNDPVSVFVDDFGKYGKNAITIRHLL